MTPTDAERCDVEPAPGTRIGRYVVEDVIGRGGMGVVMRAHDPTLDRPVALKLVHGRPDPDRLLREARALARLDHPSIIDVYDAGPYQGGIFIAIEYFEGGSMQEWLESHRPGLDAMLDLFLRLADALRSAHCMGIVHRDVKPHNVLVDAQTGAVRVVDFGLARSYRSTGVDAPPPSSRSSTGTLGVVTREDWVVGTPPYMAPEGLRGQPPSREADAWALGVTLYEALHGRRPFQGSSPEELYPQMFQPVTIAGEVPRSIRRVLRGLLEPDAARRWTIDRAYAVLRRHRARQRRRGIALGVAALIGAGTALGALASSGTACTGDPEAAHAVWNDQARGEVAAAFTAAASYGDHAWARLRPTIDDRFAAWVDARARVCDEPPDPARPGPSPMAECLDRHLGALEATVATLRQPTPMLVARVDELAERLPHPAACADPDPARGAREQLAPMPEAPQTREAAARLRARLTALSLTRMAGRLEAARAQAEALGDEATALGDGPVIAEVALERGRVLAELHHHQPAEEAFREAIAAGLRPDYLRVRAEASLALVDALGRGQKRFAEADEALRNTRVLVRALGDRGLSERLELAVARLRLAGEDFTGARAVYERLLASEPTRVRRDDLLHGLAASLVVDDQPRAATLLHEALRLRTEAYGPAHPRVADTLVLMGRIARHDARPGDAIAHLQRAREIRVPLFGEASAAVGEIDSGLGSAAVALGELETARLHLEAALRAFDADPDGVRFDTTATRSTLGIVYARLGRFEDALREHHAAMEMIAATAGPEHRRMALPLLNVASTYRRMGELDDAMHWQRKAIAANVIEHQRAKLQLGLAEMLRLRGRPTEASVLVDEVCPEPTGGQVCALARVVGLDLELDAGGVVSLDPLAASVREHYAHHPEQLAQLRLLEARIAWRAGQRTLARAHARAALEAYGTGVAVEDYDQRRVRRWLDAHR